MPNPSIISGGIYSDERGKISFVNDFGFEKIKRFYIIEHPDIQIVRAWQAHKNENKWFSVISGSFLIAWVKINDWTNPDMSLEADHRVLGSSKSEMLHIPSGYANGFKAVEKNSKMIVFSDFTLEESTNDNFRFDKDRWFTWFENDYLI